MYNFCTLFDSNYLSRALAMYQSLSKHCKNFHLYIFPFNDKTFEVLQKFNLPNTTLIPLKQFEDEKLLKVKKERSKIEYFWTCSSSIILHVLKNYKVDNCTYLDSDIYFFASPKVLIDELGKDSVIITEHRFTPIYDRSIKVGIYCVQFVFFKNDKQGIKVLKWWNDACISCCCKNIEEGKDGDQKYLDDWPKRFKGIHILQHLGGGLAPWNVQQYDFYIKDSQLFGKKKENKKEFQAIFYHFHGVKFLNNDRVDIGGYEISEDVINYFYKPYLLHLEKIRKYILSIDSSFDPHGAVNPKRNLKTILRFIKRRIITIGKNNYNIYSISNLRK